MLGVSVVAWLALLLAEFGQFRLGLLALLLLEQHPRAGSSSEIKRRVTAKQSFVNSTRRGERSRDTRPWHMIRKGQARWVSGSDVRQQIQFINTLFEGAA